jgi:hypothetical protein
MTSSGRSCDVGRECYGGGTMGQLKLIAPANVLPLRVGRAFRGKQWQGEAKENDHASDATQPPLPLTPQRLELLNA